MEITRKNNEIEILTTKKVVIDLDRLVPRKIWDIFGSLDNMNLSRKQVGKDAVKSCTFCGKGLDDLSIVFVFNGNTNERTFCSDHIICCDCMEELDTILTKNSFNHAQNIMRVRDRVIEILQEMNVDSCSTFGQLSEVLETELNEDIGGFSALSQMLTITVETGDLEVYYARLKPMATFLKEDLMIAVDYLEEIVESGDSEDYLDAPLMDMYKKAKEYNCSWLRLIGGLECL